MGLVECRCGFSGMCGYQLCTDQALEKLICTCCYETGQLQRPTGKADRDVGTMTVSSVVEASKPEYASPEGQLSNKRKRATPRKSVV